MDAIEMAYINDYINLELDIVHQAGKFLQPLLCSKANNVVAPPVASRLISNTLKQMVREDMRKGD